MYVWQLTDLETGAEHWFNEEHIALHNAERIAGDRACDGTGRFRLTRVDRDKALAMGADLMPAD